MRTAGFSRWEILGLGAILIIAGVLRFQALGRAPLWCDEQGQLLSAREDSFSGIWRQALEHGPSGPLNTLDNAAAYHLLGATRSYLRFPQALEGLLTVLVLALVGRSMFSTRAGLLAAALLGASALHIHYSREARGYALFTLLCLLFVLLLDSALKYRPVSFPGVRQIKALSGLAVLSFLLVGVNPLTVVFGAGVGLGLICAWITGCYFKTRTHWLNFSLAAGAIAAGTALSAWICYGNMPTAYNLDPHLENSLPVDIIFTYKALIGGYWGSPAYLVAAFIPAAIFSAFISPLKKENDAAASTETCLQPNTLLGWRWSVCLCAGVGTAAAVPVILSHYLRWFTAPRYSLFAMPFLFLLCAAGMDWLLTLAENKWPRLAKPSWRALLAPIIMLVLLANMALIGRSPYDLEAKKVQDPRMDTLAKP